MKKSALIVMFLVVLSYQASVFSQDSKNRREPFAIEEKVTPEMYVFNNRLYVKNAPVGKRVEIITIIGNKIREFQITSADSDYELNLPRAIYIFRMDGMVKKFVIK